MWTENKGGCRAPERKNQNNVLRLSVSQLSVYYNKTLETVSLEIGKVPLGSQC